MRNFLLIILLMAAATSYASPSEDFYRSYPTDNAFVRAQKAYDFCDTLFKEWPTPSYQDTILQVGTDLTTQPDAAYFLINTCQTQWVARFLNPLKPIDPQAPIDHSRMAYLLSAWDLIQKPRLIHEQIRLFAELYLPADPSIPTAPYVVLVGLAAGVQDMDEVIHNETRLAYSTLAGVLAVPAYVAVGSAVAESIAARSAMLAKVSKSLLIGAIVAAAVDEVVDVAIWEKRQHSLWAQVSLTTQKLEQGDKVFALPILLDEFFTATKRLGYFYSYSLYLSNSGLTETAPEANAKCLDGIKTYFTDPTTSATGMVDQFVKKQTCSDAASIWISASQYLKTRFPANAQASQVADRLLSQAKSAFLAYQETKAAEARQPICTPTMTSAGDSYLDCRDRATGGISL
jgi:hypothetical protein